jgi:hypothetical protein
VGVGVGVREGRRWASVLTATLAPVGDRELVVALPADAALELAEATVGAAVGPADGARRHRPGLPALRPADALGHAPAEDAAPALGAPHPVAARPAGVALDAPAEDLPEEEGPVVVVLLAVGARLGRVRPVAALLPRHALGEDLLAAAGAVHV